jgi:diaminopimelate epimerase
MGNPHAVVAVEDVDVVDLAALGRLLPDVNLEVVAPLDGGDGIRLRVHERGAGITEACGTGAAAAALAAAQWGMAAPDEHGEILVRMDGGDAKVRLRPDGDLVLIGPATFIASIETFA